MLYNTQFPASKDKKDLYFFHFWEVNNYKIELIHQLNIYHKLFWYFSGILLV